MQITDVRVFPVRDDKLKAFVSVVFESCFMVNDIKVINGRDGYFISMPSRRKKNGEFKDIAHPLNTDTRRMLEERILDEYEQVVALNEPPVRRYQKEQEGSEVQAETQSPEAPAATAPAPPASVAEPEADVRGASEPVDEEPAEVETEKPRADQQAAESADEEPAPAAESEADDKNRKDMDEVVETHLSDAFWS